MVSGVVTAPKEKGPSVTSAEAGKEPCMVSVKRANGRITIRIEVGDVTITVEIPL
jgi:predicted metal-dependent hydrolase